MEKHVKRNLEKLADFLEENISEENFDMRFYMRSKAPKEGRHATKGMSVVPESVHCGSVGCAPGWSARALGEGSRLERPGESWKDWIMHSRVKFDDSQIANGWLWQAAFSCYWHEIDGTKKGAVKRIRWVLKNGLGELPLDANEDVDMERFFEIYSKESA